MFCKFGSDDDRRPVDVARDELLVLFVLELDRPVEP